MKKSGTVIRTPEDLVALIRAEKSRQGITGRDLAGRAGISISTLGNWVQGIRVPNVYTLLLALDGLELEMVIQRRKEGGGDGPGGTPIQNQ